MNALSKAFAVALPVLCLTLATSGYADPRDHWDQHDNNGRSDHGWDHRDNNGRSDHDMHRDDHNWNRHHDRIVIRDNDRTVIHNYIVRHHCRHGHNCWTTGKRYYRVGYAMPANVTWYEVPHGLAMQLGEVPYGYHYVRVGGDILLLDNSGMVVDAITY
jgi:hypothetical protein